MSPFAPYQGSLMRLAFTTIAIMAVFAGAFSYWQESTARKVQGSAFTVQSYQP